MISNNLTLEITVDHQRLLTRVALLDHEAGVIFPIPLADTPGGFKVVRTTFDNKSTQVLINNEGLQQMAEVFEQVAYNEPPPGLALNEWEMKEVLFDRAYATSFAHGTGGHHERLLVSKLLTYILDLGGDLVLGGTNLASNISDTSSPRPSSDSSNSSPSSAPSAPDLPPETEPEPGPPPESI